MIAVVGATGNTGRAVVKELTQLGHAPICVVRNADKARDVLGEDAKTTVAELTDRPTLERAFKGVTSVFVVTGHNPNMVEQQKTVLEAALGAGVQNLVRVSGSRFFLVPDSPSVIGRGHYAIEEQLRRSGIKWVILLLHAKYLCASGFDQERRQDRTAFRRRSAIRFHRRTRHWRCRRARPSQPRAPHR
jgi:NAD(P)H dehydrogenase (quinone)